MISSFILLAIIRRTRSDRRKESPKGFHESICFGSCNAKSAQYCWESTRCAWKIINFFFSTVDGKLRTQNHRNTYSWSHLLSFSPPRAFVLWSLGKSWQIPLGEQEYLKARRKLFLWPLCFSGWVRAGRQSSRQLAFLNACFLNDWQEQGAYTYCDSAHCIGGRWRQCERQQIGRHQSELLVARPVSLHRELQGAVESVLA